MHLPIAVSGKVPSNTSLFSTVSIIMKSLVNNIPYSVAADCHTTGILAISAPLQVPEFQISSKKANGNRLNSEYNKLIHGVGSSGVITQIHLINVD